MARRSRSRDLAGLAALGALGYTFFGPGRDRPKGVAKAPVEYRDVSGAPAGGIDYAALAGAEDAARGRYRVSPSAADARLQETFMGLDNVSGPLSETGGVGRTENVASDQTKKPPIDYNAQAALVAPAAAPAAVAPAAVSSASRSLAPAAVAPAAVAPAAVAESARGRGTNRAAPPAVIGPRSTGQGGAYASDIRAEEARRAIREGRVRKDAQPPVIGPRSTGRGGATAAELAEYQRQQERDRMRGHGYRATYKKGGSVKAKPKKMASGGMSSASKRADGIATKGKTKCKMY